MDQNIVKLFEKYLNNQCAIDELETVISIIESEGYLEEWNHVLSQDAEQILESKNYSTSRSEISRLETHHKLLNSIRAGEKVPPMKTFKSFWKPLSIAAAASFVIFFSWWFFVRMDNQITSANYQIKYDSDIAPGKTGARLRLTTGKVVNLDGSKNELVIGNKSLSYSDGTDLGYAAEVQGSNSYTAWTDNGNMYKLTLPDGTQVWLNAGSQLDFPAKFTGHRRLVNLKGEAFFKVAKNKTQPFVVECEGQQVEVLGTEFNINSYLDERATKTTLVEGSISITSTESKFIMKPGQQASLNAEGSLVISAADTTLATAWKNNKFIFENNDIQSVMRMIKRWYNVDVIYASDLPQVTFGGKVSRFQHVSGVLRVLERTGGVHFKIEGNKIYVSK